jgi:hypothetical protein
VSPCGRACVIKKRRQKSSSFLLGGGDGGGSSGGGGGGGGGAATTAKLHHGSAVRVFCARFSSAKRVPLFLSHRRVYTRGDSIEKPAGSLCCQEIMAVRIVNKVIGLWRAPGTGPKDRVT